MSLPVPEELPNGWTRTAFTDDGDGNFTISWTIDAASVNGNGSVAGD